MSTPSSLPLDLARKALRSLEQLYSTSLHSPELERVRMGLAISAANQRAPFRSNIRQDRNVAAVDDSIQPVLRKWSKMR